jgi:non-heme Fe2+,alpha-ketoglutarate-dependent halogenase
MPRRLTVEQIAAYRTDGIAFPISALPMEEAERYRDACDALEINLGGKPRTIEVRQMHLHLGWAFELATRPAILDAVEDLLGPDLLIWATELFTKHPQDSTVSIHWHRDQPYLGLIGGSSVTAWIALSRSIPANGCMCALPRSAEVRSASSASSAGRQLTEIPPGSESSVLSVRLEPGEMSLHAADVLHGSGPSESGEKRIGFVIRYITPDARPVHGKPPVVIARGNYRYHHFPIAEPPVGTDDVLSLAAMRGSALRHLDIILENLKRSESSQT